MSRTIQSYEAPDRNLQCPPSMTLMMGVLDTLPIMLELIFDKQVNNHI